MKHYLELAYELNDLISSDPRVISLVQKEKEMENNEEVMALSYNKQLKETYLSDALKHFSKDSPEVRKAHVELFHAYEKFDAHPLVKEYLKAYKEVEAFYKEIDDALFGEIKS